MLAALRTQVVMLVLLTALTGVAYPLLVTAAARGLFPRQAAGSLIERDGHPIGSELVGQSFESPAYFWGRPSATAPAPYDAAASAGSNLGPLNPALRDQVAARIERLRRSDPGLTGPIPADLVTASGSGLDPHLSPAGAAVQVPRVAAARGRSEAEIRAILARHVEGPQFGLLGESRVHVLRLNLALDAATGRP